MMDRWDEKNPYEKLLRELMPKKVTAMESRKLMNLKA